MRQPQAAAVRRVPRSPVDDHFVKGRPPPATRLGAGEVTDLEATDTVTVLMNDEELTGVFVQGNLPALGDQIEVWTMDDLLYSPGLDDGPGGGFTNTQTGSNYTLTIEDIGVWIVMDNPSASTLTVPADLDVDFPVGTVVEGIQWGTGLVTITPAPGVTVNADPGLVTAAQFAVFGLRKIAANTWAAYGRLAT